MVPLHSIVYNANDFFYFWTVWQGNFCVLYNAEIQTCAQTHIKLLRLVFFQNDHQVDLQLNGSESAHSLTLSGGLERPK